MMMITANLHNVTHARAYQAAGELKTSWLELKSSDNSEFTIFMPYGQAVAMAAAFYAFNADAKVEAAE